MSASQMLLNNNGAMSNAEFFMRDFSAGYEAYRDELWERFKRFYEIEYDQFQSLVSVPEAVREVFLKLKQKKMKIVIASNPMWPLNIQMKRISWAGIGDLDFDLVTHIENMSFCKPRIEYYQEICRKIKLRPQQCLMVGNDPVNDMIVATIGMKTFLTVDSVEVDDSSLALSRELRKDAPSAMITPDFMGPISDVPDAVAALLAEQNAACTGI
jgi:FMN phosphatase YigB (HAD superfamily)